MLARSHYEILILEANTAGADLVVADLHGELSVFNAFITKVQNSSNRGFCCGDLIDRGPGSLEIMRAIHELNSDPLQGKIYVALGNHEIMCRDAIDKLEYVAKTYHGDARDIERNAEKIIANNKKYKLNTYVVSNGGRWLFNLFVKELSEGKIKLDQATNQITYHDNSDIKFVADFINQLPITIYVKGDFLKKSLPFLIVHADMPIDDFTFLSMVHRGNLSIPNKDAYIDHATLRRVKFNNSRTKRSMLVLVGHNIVSQEYPAVDASLNKLYLDFCAWIHKKALCVNMSALTCEWLSEVNDYGEHFVYEYNDAFESIKNHLIYLKETAHLLSDVHACRSLPELRAIAERYQIGIHELLDTAISNDAIADDLITTICRSDDSTDLVTLIENGFDPGYKSINVKLVDHCHYAMLQRNIYKGLNSPDLQIVESAFKAGAHFIHVRQDGRTTFDAAKAAGCLQEFIALGLRHSNEQIRNQSGWTNLHTEAILSTQHHLDEVIDTHHDPIARLLPAMFDELIQHLLLLNPSNWLFSEVLAEFYHKQQLDGGYLLLTPTKLIALKKMLDAKFIATWRANPDAFSNIIRDGIHPYYCFQDGLSLIDLASEFNDQKSFYIILNRRLLYAVKIFDKLKIKEALSAGADFFHVNENGESPFMYAMRIGRIDDYLQFLHILPDLKQIPKGLEVPKNSGWSPQHTAVLKGEKTNNRTAQARIPKYMCDILVWSTSRANNKMVARACEKLNEYATKVLNKSDHETLQKLTPYDIRSALDVLEELDWPYMMQVKLLSAINKKDRKAVKQILNIGFIGNDGKKPIFQGWHSLHVIALTGNFAELAQARQNLNAQELNPVASIYEVTFRHLIKFYYAGYPQLEDVIMRFCMLHRVAHSINVTPDNIVELRLLICPTISKKGFISEQVHETVFSDTHSNAAPDINEKIYRKHNQ